MLHERRQVIDLGLECKGGPRPVAKAHATTIVPDDAEPCGQTSKEPAVRRIVRVSFEMTYPPCRQNGERTLTLVGVCDALPGTVPKESNLHHGHIIITADEARPEGTCGQMPCFAGSRTAPTATSWTPTRRFSGGRYARRSRNC